MIKITHEKLTCSLCGREINLKFLGDSTDLHRHAVAVHALAHLRDEVDLLPEKSDLLHALLDHIVPAL